MTSPFYMPVIENNSLYMCVTYVTKMRIGSFFCTLSRVLSSRKIFLGTKFTM